MGSEIDELRDRVAELERRVEALFRHSGATDWEQEASKAPGVSEEVRTLLAEGDTKKAVKRHREEPEAEMGEAVAALGKTAEELRGA